MRTRPDLEPVSYRPAPPPDEPTIRHDGVGTLWFVAALLGVGLLVVLLLLGG